MLGVVATIKVKDGQGAEFEKVATELVKKVNENEKGCLLYQLYHGEEANTYVFLERYANDAAVEEHRGTSISRRSAAPWARSWTGSRWCSGLSRWGLGPDRRHCEERSDEAIQRARQRATKKRLSFPLLPRFLFARLRARWIASLRSQ